MSLKERYKIEHVIQRLKTLNRIRARQEKLAQNYEEMVYLGMIIKFVKPISDEELSMKKIKN